ncbi:MAG: type I-C CRISPR-associated protein Cas8c/Csd1, partial [Fibrobacter sp.]|nr:type I-C CRISPR-associated protein Cas8c/Csd1 [Fibrobacter sp.]
MAKILTSLSSDSDFSEQKAQQFLIQLTEALLKGCEEGRLPFDFVQPLLVSETKPKDITFFHNNQQSYLNNRIKMRVNELVMIPKTDKADGTCSLTGQPAALVHSPFPQVNLPVLGQKTVIMAMNKDVPCHNRYGVISSDICPVGKEMANKIASALARITEKDNEGFTWKGIPSPVRKKRDLLIVYCEENPMACAKYAETISGNEDEDEDEENDSNNEQNQAQEQFRQATKSVILGVEGKESDVQNSHLRCFILREIDPGRRRVVYSDTFTVQELFTACQSWQDAGKIIPKIQYTYSQKRGVSATLHKAGAPSLSQAVLLFQTAWGSDMTRPVEIAGLSFHEILGLLLGRKNLKHSPRKMLSMLVHRTEALLSAVGEADHIHNSEIRNTEVKAKKTVLQVAGLFCILLKKMAEYESVEKESVNDSLLYLKENYMNDVFYNYGRFLMLIDKLHIEYCLDVRGGNEIPSKLLGNAMIPVANANGIKALARLEERLIPYMGWANRFTNSPAKKEQSETGAEINKQKLVGWLLNELRGTIKIRTRSRKILGN